MNPMNLQFFAAVTASSILAGCAPINVIDVSSSYYRLPAGTTVIVRQTITIPPETAHVTLQDGQAVGIDRLRRYEPFCELEVNDVLESEQQVRPGRFVVPQIIRWQKLYGTARPPVLLAANTVTAMESDASSAVMLLAERNESFWLNEVRLRLQSAAQPNVRELRCAGGWAFISAVAYPTLAEMNRALGALISIEIKEAMAQAPNPASSIDINRCCIAQLQQYIG